jgi:hypothetical protein
MWHNSIVHQPIPSREDGHGDQFVGAKSHNIGVCSSLNYLGSPPHYGRALQRTGRAAWAEEFAVVAAAPHRLTCYRGHHAVPVEAFSRADLNDAGEPADLSGARKTVPLEH